MKDEIRLTRDIHNFVRGHLSWEESLRLLDETVESEEWFQHLVIDIILNKMACKNREKAVSEPPIPIFY